MLEQGAAISLDDAALVQTIPASYYRDPEIFQEEREKVFFKTWQLVGHVSELPKPGDYRVKTILDQEVVIIRGSDGVLRAFFNVCAHRAHPLVRGDGNCGHMMTCAYHAWTYTLD